MRIEIGYFTSTGNTLWLLIKAKKLMEDQGHTVHIFDVVTDGLTYTTCADMVGIFYPVWGSSLPDPIRTRIPNMEQGNGKPMFLIGNCAVFTGDTGMYWKNIIEKKNYNVFYVDHLLMPININVPGFNWWRVPEQEKKENILKKAEKRLQVVCDSILASERKTDGTSLLAVIGGNFQRKCYGIINIWKKMLSIDTDRCSFCGLCYKMCPTENITIIHNKEIQFGSTCILCLKCYNLCPQNAVLVGKSSRDSTKFRRYTGPFSTQRFLLYR